MNTHLDITIGTLYLAFIAIAGITAVTTSFIAYVRNREVRDQYAYVSHWTRMFDNELSGYLPRALPAQASRPMAEPAMAGIPLSDRAFLELPTDLLPLVQDRADMLMIGAAPADAEAADPKPEAMESPDPEPAGTKPADPALTDTAPLDIDPYDFAAAGGTRDEPSLTAKDTTADDTKSDTKTGTKSGWRLFQAITIPAGTPAGRHRAGRR
jgi:hypothetical protein